MTIQEIFNMLVRAKRPMDFFGNISDTHDLRKIYVKYAKIVHEDNVLPKDKYIASQAFLILQELYDMGRSEFEQGIYDVTNPIDLYKSQDPLFELNVKGNKYAFYECICNGEVADIYRGICGDRMVCIKIVANPNDNDLLKKEYDLLMKYSHTSMPIVREFIEINDCASIIMDEIEGEPLVSIMDRNKQGIPVKHVMWIMERLFSVTGYLHSNLVVHENIIPENILINTKNHNVILTGFSFHIPSANENSAHYMITNEKFSAPEISNTATVIPQSDIYSLGRLCIYMLGGSLITGGLPVGIPADIKDFIRKLCIADVNKRPNDAWALWDEWAELRTKNFGKERFLPANF